MNRETEQHFSEIPYIDKPRSKFKKPFTHKTTFNTGDLIPIFLDQDILPGSTVKIDMSMVVRMATPLYPVMDNAYLDIYFFFVPNRLVWDHWKAFWGENTSAWYQTIEYEVPQIITTGGFWPKGLVDYMGLPCNPTRADIPGKNYSVSALPFRAYVKVWNDWFRDENLQQEAPNTTSDSNLIYSSDAYRGGGLLKVNKFHGYYESALPAPQKGSEVLLPLGKYAPVGTLNNTVPGITTMNTPLQWYVDGGIGIGGQSTDIKMAEQTGDLNTGIDINDTSATPAGFTPMRPSNLWTDLSMASAATINQLRQAFAVQRFFEAQARGGSRYIEFLKNIFGVTSPDARLQRSEYLGGARVPINMMAVAQTSSTNATSPQGNLSAYSQTADSRPYFTKSFTEHGILLGCCCVRTDRTYNQGIERGWSRKKWTDFFVPQFSNLSEQAILNKEIYAQGTSTDEEVFGYQEAWAEYRYKPSMVTGAMRTTYAQSLDAWHYADHYTSLPILGPTWIQEPKTNVDRTIAVSSDIENQFIGDFYFDTTYVMPMPLYSVPGLIDHF